MKDVVVLTSSELRHDFVRQALGIADGIRVSRSYREGLGGTTTESVRSAESEIKRSHLEARARAEQDFFGSFVDLVDDRTNPVDIERGAINDPEQYNEIIDLEPDLVLAYGCSLVDSPLLDAFEGRFLNVHLGLSPYYRGTGTNFWPLVNEEPEYVGATFMHIDEGVDTGEIIHQIRARVYPGDSPHQIGNRLIADMTHVYIELVRRFDRLESVEQPAAPREEHYYTSADYSEAATETLYENFDDGLVDRYLSEYESRTQAVPIVTNPALAGYEPASEVPFGER